MMMKILSEVSTAVYLLSKQSVSVSLGFLSVQNAIISKLKCNRHGPILSTSVCRYSSTHVEEGCIYIHWPYCQQLCSYCNFVKFIPRPGKYWTFPNDVIENGLVKELENLLQKSYIKSVISVYFGGGTPSLASPKLVDDILKVISKVSSLSETAEVTLEANPTKLETKKLKEFKKAGINRLSIGVQSLWPDYLKVLNRNHSVDEAVRCIKKAKNIFPGKVSVDMMFALPFQTVDEWQKDLEAMLQICDDHLSLYQLTLEKGTKLYKAVHSGNLSVPDEEIQADLYEMAVSVLQDNLFHRYEVSNFAKTTEAESIHNKAVWQGTQFIGIGPGAHSRVYAATEDSLQHSKTSGSDYIREARRNVADPASWLAEVNGKGNGIRLRETQSMLDIQLEYISTSLRTMEGVNHQRWMDICSIPLNEYINPDSVDNEILYYDTNGDFRATPKGLNVLDSYLPKLINMIRDCTQRSNGIVLNNK